MKPNRISMSCLVLAAGLLSACASQGPIKGYQGPAQPASALALVNLPAVLDLSAIDGQEQSFSLGGRPATVQLTAGEHVLTLRYSDVFKARNGDEDVVRSRPLALRFTAVAGDHYDFLLTPPADEESAVRFAHDPQAELQDAASGQHFAAIVVRSVGESSLLDTLTAVPASKGQQSADTANLELLKDVWSRATPDERKAFKAWQDAGDKPATGQ